MFNPHVVEMLTENNCCYFVKEIEYSTNKGKFCSNSYFYFCSQKYLSIFIVRRREEEKSIFFLNDQI